MRTNAKKRIIPAIVSFLGTIAAAAFSPLFIYFQNAGEAHFQEIVPTMLTFMAIGAVLFVLFFLWTKNLAKAGLIATVFLLVLLNYAYVERGIQAIFHSLRYWHILPILLVLLLHIGWLVRKKLPDDLCVVIVSVTSGIFVLLILFNGTMAVQDIIGKNKAEKQMDQIHYLQNDASAAEMPNIYFLMFDEYSSYDFMKKYYDYDNMDFMNKLKDIGFSISYTSHNESILTSTVVANLMNLEYIVDDSWAEYDKILARKSGALYSLLMDNGYSLYSMTDDYGLPLLENAAVSAGSGSAMTVGGETLKDLLLNNSVFYPLVTKYGNGLRSTLDSIEAFVQAKEKSRFLVAHFHINHTPFMYDQDGNVIDNINSDWADKQYYLNTYIYATKVMDELIDCILEFDPDSIIILQSDHGARASTDLSLFFVLFPIEDMSNCFNCVYYPGELLNIEGVSGVNTERLIFGKLFNVDLPSLEVPLAKR